MSQTTASMATSEGAKRGRKPEFRNIHVSQIRHYRLPLPGIVSILHRISGAGMFLVGLPVVLWLLQESLVSELGFDRFLAVVAHPLAKLVLLGLTWAYAHHFCAGIRYLMLDTHRGVDKVSATRSARSVLVASLAITAVVALKLFGLF